VSLLVRLNFGGRRSSGTKRDAPTLISSSIENAKISMISSPSIAEDSA
jgi:hypothetical protein